MVRARSASRAHPRSRGEHRAERTGDATLDGSPPLARGALDATHHRGPPVGLTPARAGSTSGRSSSPCASWAHPRSRGEHDRRSHEESVVDRLTPARAGSTARRSGESCPSRAHPRSRGEHPRCMRMRTVMPGSPPLARGALPPGQVRPCVGGLTPARAGSTLHDLGFTSTSGHVGFSSSVGHRERDTALSYAFRRRAALLHPVLGRVDEAEFTSKSFSSRALGRSMRVIPSTSTGSQ